MPKFRIKNSVFLKQNADSYWDNEKFTNKKAVFLLITEFMKVFKMKIEMFDGYFLVFEIYIQCLKLKKIFLRIKEKFFTYLKECYFQFAC